MEWIPSWMRFDRSFSTFLKISLLIVTTGSIFLPQSLKADGVIKTGINHGMAMTPRDTSRSAELQKNIAHQNTKADTSKQEMENRLLRETELKQKQRIARQRGIGIIIILLLISSIAMSMIITRSRERLKALNVEISAQKLQLEKEAEFRLKLFSIVSHDFRSPISTLQGYMYMLEDNLLDPEELRQMSIEMNMQLQITADFAENLLNWSASQLQGYHPHVEEINLYNGVEEVFNLYRKQADMKGLRLENKIEKETVIQADNDFLRLVLRNLVSNGIKFTDKGFIRISGESNEDEFIIHVQDTGCGINETAKNLLFTDAARPTEGTAHEKGSGLGLLLSKEFIKTNGGRIWVETAVGKGSIFSFSIPLQSNLI
jgi:signal transduction histidine kinase